MSPEPRRLRVVRAAPAPELIERGQGGSEDAAPLRLENGSPLGVMRLGATDLEVGFAAAREGALPAAVTTGIGELPEVTSRARRLARELELPWIVDPLLFKTALPGYRTAQHLQTLDYTPGRDSEPYLPDDFDDLDFLRRVGRNVVGSELDLGASAAVTGCFVASSSDDRWVGVTAGLARAGVDARDAFAPVPVIASVAVRMLGFETLESQRLLVRALASRRPDAVLLMLDGLHEDSSAARIAASIRLGLLLRATGARVIVGRAGDLRRLFVAVDLDVEYGLGRLLRFFVPDYRKRGGPGPTPPRFELPSLAASLPAEQAARLLRLELVQESQCTCPACRDLDSVSARIDEAPRHDAHMVAADIRSAGAIALERRMAALDAQLVAAEHGWGDLLRARAAEAVPPRLGKWREALDIVAGWELLSPEGVARQLELP